jgi:uncharacterized Zn ribbon protein
MQNKIYSRTIRCPKCQSKKTVGSIYQFMCLQCGHKFQTQSKEFKEYGFVDKTKDTSKFINSDCNRQCPRCQSNNVTKKQQGNAEYCICQSCKHFDKIENFEAV